MALQQSVTNPATGEVYPTAYCRVDDATLELANNQVQITVSAYFSSTTAGQNLAPVYTFPLITLPTSAVSTANPTFVQGLQAAIQAGSILSPRDALLTALYLMVQAQPGFQAATKV